MSIKNIVIIAMALMQSLQSYSQAMKEYSGNGLTISYPDTWENMTYPNTVFLLIRPLEEQGQKFRENVNLIISDSKGLTLDEYAALTKLQFPKHLTNFEIVATNNKIIGGKSCKELVYRHDHNDLQLKVVYYLFIINDKAYEFTCSTLQSNYNYYYPVFSNMMNSLVFNNLKRE
jgi:hypothetical protein